MENAGVYGPSGAKGLNPNEQMIAERLKALGYATDAPRLYHLDDEIGEKTNVAAAHPEIVAERTALAAKISAEIGGKHPTARRPAGSVAEPKMLYPAIRAKKENK